MADNQNMTTDTIYASDGAIRQDGPLPVTRCKYCHSKIVWATSKRTGKRYPVNVSKGWSEGLRENYFYMKNHFHKCEERI